MNENLVPVLIIDLVRQYKKSINENEKLQLENRLKDIREYIDTTLKNQKLSDLHNYNMRK